MILEPGKLYKLKVIGKFYIVVEHEHNSDKRYPHFDKSELVLFQKSAVVCAIDAIVYTRYWFLHKLGVIFFNLDKEGSKKLDDLLVLASFNDIAG